MKKFLLLLISGFLFAGNSFSQIYPGHSIGPARIQLSKGNISVHNQILSAQWSVKNQTIEASSFKNQETGKLINWNNEPWFSVILKNGEKLTSNDFKLLSDPRITLISANKSSVKRSGKDKGQQLSTDLYCSKAHLKIHWSVILKDNSNYLREQFTLTPKDSINIDQIILLEIPTESGLQSKGIVAGSPLENDGIFCAFEHPMSHNETEEKQIISFVKRYTPLISSTPLTYSIAWGVAPKSQLRRAFLYYIERERAVPYRQEVHYNSWFDLSFGDRKLNEKSCMERMQTFADSLIIKRHTSLKAFLFDDGWDNNQTLWQFNSGFPNGFSNMQKLAQKYHSSIGVWLSPFGGYGQDKEQRIQYGLAQNPPFETNENGFSLAGPTYYKRFRDVTVRFVKQYGITIFKIDGVGEGNGSIGSDARYEKDIDALLHLVSDVRLVKPDIYYSLTTGTWASPYWLYYGDAIWRSGGDNGFAGSGSKRQQWITYRDGETYRNIVLKGELYPLNSVMYHGICIADCGIPSTLEMNDQDITDEIWDLFSSGTSLQELYINPHKLSSKNWDTLARAIQWSRANEKTLADIHWVGGDPEKEEVYGRAAWSPSKAIISLRNPSAEVKHFHVDVDKVFEIPNNEPQKYNFSQHQIYNQSSETFNNVKEFDITLQPYEIKILEGSPVK